MKRVDLRLGNCLEVLKQIPDNSIDSCVCDPPYGIQFMKSKWDYDVPKTEIWQEVLRVLKPGGHLLAFFGTRTYHRGVVNIEDAGFEIRDQIGWAFGSGFPKSHDVSKAIDAAAGAVREVVGQKYVTNAAQGRGLGEGSLIGGTVQGEMIDVTAPATPDAQRWQGWGTALKPAWEPIVVARKPLEGTVAANVLAWGTGAINVDGCRVGTEEAFGRGGMREKTRGYVGIKSDDMIPTRPQSNLGRWPANLIHDGSEEVLELFPMNGKAPHPRTGHDDDGGSAARFFYCAKPSVSEKEAGLDELEDSTLNRVNSGGLENDPKWAPKTRKNNHPTVKPVKLMQYLCRLITPPGGTVLDPFMGSGTTGMAAASEGFNFLGIELDEHYLEIARARIAHYNKQGEE